ncbi:hypothetical protein VINE108521_08980 [Vibrio neonatus]
MLNERVTEAKNTRIVGVSMPSKIPICEHLLMVKMFDHQRNKPADLELPVGSNKLLWWRCLTPEYQGFTDGFVRTPHNLRNAYNKYPDAEGCPICSRNNAGTKRSASTVAKNGNLAVIHPYLVAEWQLLQGMLCQEYVPVSAILSSHHRSDT